VNVPVKLYSAVSKKTVRFNQLHDADHARIQQKRVCSEDGEEVPYENIVKGFEIAPDRYVVITPDELEALDPTKTRSIDIEDFVDLTDIDPLYYEHPYYLLPDTGAAKAYKLLLEALRETNKVAIARVVLRTKEYLVAIRPAGDVLTMETMLFADELIAADGLDELPDADVKATERELSMARQLIEAQATDFDPSKYRDEYRERVLELIERKAAGEEIVVQPLAEESQEVPDLMAALEQSLAAAQGGRRKAPAKTASNGGATAKKPSGTRKTTKKKPAAKKPRAGSRS
jgi:DNA end-binding protein Ku